MSKRCFKSNTSQSDIIYGSDKRDYNVTAASAIAVEVTAVKAAFDIAATAVTFALAAAAVAGVTEIPAKT